MKAKQSDEHSASNSTGTIPDLPEQSSVLQKAAGGKGLPHPPPGRAPRRAPCIPPHPREGAQQYPQHLQSSGHNPALSTGSLCGPHSEEEDRLTSEDQIDICRLIICRSQWKGSFKTPFCLSVLADRQTLIPHLMLCLPKWY